MNLKTEYLGLRLRTPLVPSASRLSESLDNIKRTEDAGASAIVLHSLFEEHITFERHQLHHHFTHGTESYAEALTYCPELDVLAVGPESYLDEIVAAKNACSIPIIASLNGSTLGGWTDYAKRIEEAGADALELNIYWIPTDPELTGAEVELRYRQIVSQVKETIGIPVAVKLSPFFSNIANMAQALAEAGANGLVLFNRFISRISTWNHWRSLQTFCSALRWRCVYPSVGSLFCAAGSRSTWRRLAASIAPPTLSNCCWPERMSLCFAPFYCAAASTTLP
jgi:dihydroorotate dehydrogenase (fumarate)